MKTLYLPYLLLTSLTFFSCEDNNPVSSGFFNMSKISGTIKDWNSGTDKQVILIPEYYYFHRDKIYSTSLIDSNGFFSLENLDYPGENAIMSKVYPEFINDFIILRNSVVCSDSTAKIVYGTLAVVTAGDTSFNTIGHVLRCNHESLPPASLKEGIFSTDFVYLNKNVNINGIVEFKENNSYSRWHYTYEYNLKYYKGWNKRVIIYKTYEVREDSCYEKILISNTEPWGGYWMYSPEINSEIRGIKK